MKNNRINITYHNYNGSNAMKPESLRCTSMRGAIRILSHRNKANVKRAEFTNGFGTTEKVKGYQRNHKGQKIRNN